jgi:hypothetical protein
LNEWAHPVSGLRGGAMGDSLSAFNALLSRDVVRSIQNSISVAITEADHAGRK